MGNVRLAWSMAAPTNDDAPAPGLDGVGVGRDVDLGPLLDLAGVALRHAGRDLDRARAHQPDDGLAGRRQLAGLLQPGLHDARERGHDARRGQLALGAGDAGLGGVLLGPGRLDALARGAELALGLGDPGVGLGHLGTRLGQLGLDLAELERRQDRVAVERVLAPVLVLGQVQRRLGRLALGARRADAGLGAGHRRLGLGDARPALGHARPGLRHARLLARGAHLGDGLAGADERAHVGHERQRPGHVGRERGVVVGVDGAGELDGVLEVAGLGDEHLDRDGGVARGLGLGGLVGPAAGGERERRAEGDRQREGRRDGAWSGRKGRSGV